MLNALAQMARRSVIVGGAAATLVLAPGVALARGSLLGERAPDVIAVADLPAQGKKTYALILEGGPFPYDKDGSVFGNRERVLPKEKRGYYREYTVKTPGSRDRGARRIICGGKVPTTPDACYYTSDHYNSFRRIVGSVSRSPSDMSYVAFPQETSCAERAGGSTMPIEPQNEWGMVFKKC